jgi:hypothetical protein
MVIAEAPPASVQFRRFRQKLKLQQTGTLESGAGMGTLTLRRLGKGIELRVLPFPAHGTGVPKMSSAARLWSAGAKNPLAGYGDGRSFHTKRMVCTGLSRLPVGDVGNRVWVQMDEGRISKTPEMHSQDLEKPPTGQVGMAQRVRMDFHFSGHTTEVTVFFFYLYYSFPPPSVACGERLLRSLGLPECRERAEEGFLACAGGRTFGGVESRFVSSFPRAPGSGR